jgi:hypothetical protein
MTHTSTLLAAIELRDGFKNRSRLTVRRGDNAELVLQLGSESIGNMMRSEGAMPPAFCADDGDIETVNMVEGWIKGHTNRSIVRTERGPSATAGTTQQATDQADPLLAAVRRVVTKARALELGLNDPHHDGSGRDAESPNGDSYNELMDFVELLFPFVPE